MSNFISNKERRFLLGYSIAAMLAIILLPAVFAGRSLADKKVKRNYPASIVANFPTDLIFSGNALYFTEKDGRLWVLSPGRRQARKLTSFNVPRLAGYNETGLLGLALSPGFKKNKFIYLYHSYESRGRLYNRVVRIKADKPGRRKVILDGIGGGRVHDGGKLAFGPDGKLYIATGETGDDMLAQDKNSLSGKVLRIDPDGGIPSDNPFGNGVWSYGNRNIFGMTFDNRGRLFVTENGPEKDDEINEIIRGANYGWPIVTGNAGRFQKPLIVYGDVIAPTGIIFYTGNRYPGLKGKLVFADYNGGGIHRLDIRGKRVRDRLIDEIGEPVSAIAQSPDGYIYIATENRIKRLKIK